MKAKRVRTDVWLPEELKPFAGKIGYVQSQPFADTFSLTFPNEPLCKDGDYTWVPDFFVYQVEDVEAQQHAIATPHVPAQVDEFLFGEDTPRTSGAILEINAMWSKDRARIEELEAQNATLQKRVADLDAYSTTLRGGNGVLIETLTATEKDRDELKALLSEAKQVIAPFAEATAWDGDVQRLESTTLLGVEFESGMFTYMRKEAGLLCVGHLRAIAEFASKLDAALKGKS
jgi:hypothetical protein